MNLLPPNWVVPFLCKASGNVNSTPGWGGDSHMKGVGMLVVLLRGVNFGFWCHLGCSGQNVIIFSCEGFL